MTNDEIEAYKKTARVGDRLKYKWYDQVWYVYEVQSRGVVTSLKQKYRDHLCLTEWSELRNYSIIHKEP